MTESPLKYHGGKSELAPKLRELFPGIYTRYCEPFFGGGSVLLSGSGFDKAEFVNDLYGELVNFWRVLRSEYDFQDFKRLVEATPFGHKTFGEAWNIDKQINVMDLPPNNPEAVRRAWAFFVINRQCRQGLMKDYAIPTSRTRRGMNENVSAWLSAIDGLPDVHSRLKRVEIWNTNAIDFILKLDSKDTFFYCDPPYMQETRKTFGEYNVEMSDKQHEELLKVLSCIQGTFLLSGYESDLYNDYASKNQWKLTKITVASRAGKGQRIECVWRNY
jgi:DNA adenine methylase